MRSNRNRSRAVGLVLAPVLAAGIAGLPSGVPATASSPATKPITPSLVENLEALRRLPGMAPAVARLHAAAMRAHAQPGDVIVERFAFADPVPDVSGDGVRDVVATDYRFELSFGGESLLDPEYEIKTEAEFIVLTGDTGRRLWSLSRKIEGFTGLFPVNVAPRGDNGFLFFEQRGPGGPISQYELVMIALRGKDGKRLWKETHSAQQANLQEGVAYHDVPLIFSVFDGLEGMPDDYLLGIGTVVQTYLGASLADVRARVIDGRTGVGTFHPSHEIAVNWLPEPWATHDLDHDGFDDYVFTNNHGISESNGEFGEEPPIEIGGVLKARKGNDGSDLWIAGGFEYGNFAWVFDARNMIAGSQREILVSSPISTDLGFFGNGRGWHLYLVDGGGSGIAWNKIGGWPSVLGDLDGDGTADVLSSNPFTRKGNMSMRYLAYSAFGRKIYEKVVRKPFVQAPNGYWVGWGWLPIGDMGSDGVAELGVHVSGGDDVQETADHYAFDARQARVRHRAGKERSFLSAALDGRGTDLADMRWHNGEVAVQALDGRDGSILLDISLNFGVPFEPTANDFFSSGAELTGDGCADLVGSVSAQRGGFVFVLDGGSGDLLWSYTLFGPEADVQSTVTTDENPIC